MTAARRFMLGLARLLSLTTRVMLVVVVLLVAGIWGLAARTAAVLQTELEKLLSEQLSATVHYIAADLDNKIQLHFDLLREIAAAISPDMLSDPAKVQRLLEQRNVSGALFPVGVLVANRQGINIADYPRLPGRVGGSLGDRAWFREVMAGRKQGIGSPVVGRFAKQPLVSTAVPIPDASGAPTAVLVSSIHPADQHMFGQLEQTNIGKGGYLLVASPQDRLWVSSNDKSRILQPLPAKGLNPVFDRRMEEGFEEAAVTTSSFGLQVLGVSRGMKTTGWVVIAAVPTSEVFAPIAALQRQIYLVALLISLVIALVLRFVLTRQLAPLEQAGAAMRRMTEGEEPFAPLPVIRDDEIGRLVGNFNRLATERIRLDESLHKEITERKQAEDDLRAQTERFRIGQSVAGLIVMDWDIRNDRLTWSDSPEWLRGPVPAETGKYPLYKDQVHLDDREHFLAMRAKSIETLEGQSLEYRVVRTDGEVRWVAARHVVFAGTDGKAARMFVALHNITDRKRAEAELTALNEQLEARVAERTAKLESANKELETFTYSVAHDLKAPLRGIDGYSRLLLEGYADRLDDEGRQFLHNVRGAARQMDQLTNDLLAYSRLECQDVRLRQVDPRSLVEALLAEHAAEIQSRGVAVSVAVPCQSVGADRDGLPMALRNLLENALKFTRGVAQPAIEVGGRDQGATCLLWVRDNGVGFDMKYHERIFAIFQRLHRSEDYPGTGVGLAIVRKAMQRMGGRAWAESEPGKGATFYLEIPK